MRRDEGWYYSRLLSKYVKVSLKFVFLFVIWTSALLQSLYYRQKCVHVSIHLSIYLPIDLFAYLPLLSCPVLSFCFILSYPFIPFILSYPICPIYLIYLILPYLALSYPVLPILSISSHLISSYLVCLSIFPSVCLSFYLSKNLPIYILPLCHSQHETKHAREHLRNSQAPFKYNHIFCDDMSILGMSEYRIWAKLHRISVDHHV